MLAYLWLAAAISSEVVGTLALRSSRGFTQLGPSLVVVVGYGLAFYLLSLALRAIPLGTAYAIWSGAGTAVVAVAGVVLFRERLTVPAVIGIVLIIAGVVVLQTGTAASGPVAGGGR